MKKKRLLILFLLAMLMAATDVMAQTDTLTCEANGVTWKFTVSGSDAKIIGSVQTKSELTGALNVPETLEANGTTYTVRSITGFRYYGNLTSLTLPSTLTAIEDYAFGGCSGLTGTLTIPSQVEKIGGWAFDETNFTGDLVIPNSVTSIGSFAFNDCRKLNGTLTLSNQLKTLEMNVFGYCGFTGHLDIPNSVTVIGSQSLLGNNFTSVNIPNTVREIGISAFFLNDRLKGDIVIPASVKKLGDRAFEGCSSVRSFTFAEGSQLDGVSGSIWNKCNLLEYIDLTKCDLSKITTDRVRSMFNGKLYHTLVYLPDGVDESIAKDQSLCNFVQKGECERFYVQDEYSYYMPYAFTAKSVVYCQSGTGAVQQDTTQLRTFTGANCKTIYLPYPTPMPDGMRAYELTRENRTGDHFIFTSLPDGSTLEAYHPYLIRITGNTSETLTFPRLYNISIPATPSIDETAVAATGDGSWKFFGSTEQIENADAAARGAWNLSSNVWHPVTTAQTRGYVHPFRCFIAGTGSAPAKSFSISLEEPDGTATAISGIEAGPAGSGEKGIIYTMDGRRAGTDLNALPKGIYIVNGKKIVKP